MAGNEGRGPVYELTIVSESEKSGVCLLSQVSCSCMDMLLVLHRNANVDQCMYEF